MNRRPARESGGLAVVQAAIITCFLVLLGRCAWIALVNGPDYAVRAVQQRSVDVVVARARGQVFDRDMHVLAGCRTDASSWPQRAVVVVFPSLVSGQDEALHRLDELIPGPGVCAGNPRAVSLSPAAYAEVEAIACAVRGIVPLSLPSRYSGLASHVVGDIEASYDWALDGGDAREAVRLMCDARGQEIVRGAGLFPKQPAGWARLRSNGPLACVRKLWTAGRRGWPER